jgi:hypothetical protein
MVRDISRVERGFPVRKIRSLFVEFIEMWLVVLLIWLVGGGL